jgi:hypothetical protein
MRVMKFAVVLCFTAALVMLFNYPNPVNGQEAATNAPTELAYGSGPVSTLLPQSSPTICSNYHQTLNHGN